MWTKIFQICKLDLEKAEKAEIKLPTSIVQSLSCIWLFAIPGTVAHQAPLSMGFSRQECWRGLPFPTPTSVGIIEKAREYQKTTYFWFIDYPKAFNCVNHSKLWKILKVIGIPDHLMCLLRSLYAGQEVTEPIMEQQTGSKLGKDFIHQGCILSPCLFNLMWNAQLDDS